MTDEEDRAVVVATPQVPMVYEDPAKVMERQKAQATVLADVVRENQHLTKKIGNKVYLFYELWQTIGAFNGVFPQTESVEEIWGLDDDGDPAIVAYKAVVGGYRDGVKITSAIAYCGMNSFPTRGQSGFDKNRAAMSAAQTWAGSKMFRMIFSVVAVLGGFAATTAEEMTDETPVPVTTAPPLPSTGPKQPDVAPEPSGVTKRAETSAGGRRRASGSAAPAKSFAEQKADLVPWAMEHLGFASERTVLEHLKMDSLDSITDIPRLQAAVAILRRPPEEPRNEVTGAQALLEGE
jgi:hypothetical protein